MKRNRRFGLLTLALALLFALELGFIAFIGLTRTKLLIDHDSGALLRHTMAVADARSPWVRAWNTPSTLEWDSVLAPASIFYALTGDIYLSAALGNLLVCAALCAAVFSIMRKLRLPAAAALCALTLLFAPYAFGMLDYANMLYLCGGQYGIKVLIPLLLFSLLLTACDQRRRLHTVVSAAFYFALLFLSCVSSGSYVFLCGVLPALLAVAVLYLRTGHLDGYDVAMLGLSILVSAAGYAVCRRLNASTATSAMELLPAQDIASNSAACLTGLLELFGAAGSRPVAVLGLDGLSRLSRLAVVFLLAVSAFCAFRRLRTDDAIARLCALCLSAFFVNLCVLLLCDTTYGASTFEYRYHLIGTVPLMLLPGALFFVSRPSVRLRRAVTGMFCLLLLFIDVTGARKLIAASNHAPEIEALYQEALALRAQYGADALFMLTPTEDRADYQILSLSAWQDGVTALRVFEDGRIDLFNQSTQRSDVSDFGQINLVIAQDISIFDRAIVQGLEQIGEYGRYGIYLSKACMFDGVAGVPEVGTSVDLPLTQGYAYAADGASWDAQGALHTAPEGGIVLWGPGCDGRDGVYDVTLEYDAPEGFSGSVGRFYMTEGYNTVLLGEATLDPDAHSVTLHGLQLDASMTGLEVRVHAYTGSLVIHRILYTRLSDYPK